VANRLCNDDIWLVPLRSSASGGLLLKQRNLAGDRTVLVREALADDVPVGVRRAGWDEAQGALRISRTAPAAPPTGVRPDSSTAR